MNRKIIALFFAMIIVVCSHANAYDVFGGFNPGYAMNMDVAMSSSRSSGRVCGRAYSSDYEKEQLLRLEAQGKCNNKVQSLDVNTNVTSTSLAYTPSTTRTRANLQSFANKTRKFDPEGAAKMEQLFASTDIIGQIGTVMRSYAGLNKNNAADAFALYWVSAWKASKGDVSDKSVASYKAVAAQAARGMSTSPEMARATDAQKQEMAEALLVQSALIDGMLEEYGSNPAMMAKLAQSVRQGAKASGLDLDAMTLTEQGFVKAAKKRSDASDAAPGAEPTALASASPAKTDTSEGNSLFPGILIAGLAGSGIAAAFLYGKNKGTKKGNG
jgi:hypothetical protein